MGFRSPAYLFQPEEEVEGRPMRFLHLWRIGDSRMLIEHSHRLLAVLVGCFAIVLAIGLFWWNRAGLVQYLRVGLRARDELPVAATTDHLNS